MPSTGHRLPPMSSRLIDLHTDWLLQYAQETTVFDPHLYPSVPQRIGQAEGYLQTTWAAVLSCYRNANDWAHQSKPWAALGDLITRIEAEFAGRLLIGRDDYDRWQADPNGLAWGLIGVEGFDALVRSPSDLERLPRLFERGVRLFQPLYAPSSVLGGSSAEGDDRGLSALGTGFLETLVGLADPAGGPRPIVDLAHLNPRSAADVLTWLEADTTRSERLISVYSHGALAHEGFAKPRAITLENLSRLRALGGVIGFGVSPPFYDNPLALKTGIEAAAALPFRGQAGYEGIATGTDFLGVDRTLPGLSNAAEVVAWFESAFHSKTALALIQGNARRLLARAVGASELKLDTL
jgi:membrane dipeptidase